MKARLFVLLARKKDVAVVFRRGPSRQVLLIRWDLRRDLFEAGQWLKGRIYERRCDLSPSGERLIYFAGRYRGPFRTWTAVSRPPFLKALALWPKGDAWGGGGLFHREDAILLNHPQEERKLAEGFKLPRRIKLGALRGAGRGEDDPIAHERMERDGWVLAQIGTWHEHRLGAKAWFTCDPPEIWFKPHPHLKMKCVLRVCLVGIHEQQGPWYMNRYDILGRTSDERVDLGRTDWADWSRSGDLLLAREGKLLRMKRAAPTHFDPSVPARELIDLSALAFEERVAPPAALRWSGKRPLGVRLPAS